MKQPQVYAVAMGFERVFTHHWAIHPCFLHCHTLSMGLKSKWESRRWLVPVLVLLTGSAHATTWTVDDDLADFPAADFSDIQSAVDVASNGDVVDVYSGTYTGAGTQVVDMLGKSIHLRSIADLNGDGVVNIDDLLAVMVI